MNKPNYDKRLRACNALVAQYHETATSESSAQPQPALDYYLETNETNIFYLTGFRGMPTVMLCADDHAYLLLTEMFYEQFKTLCPTTNVQPVRMKSTFRETLDALVKERSIKTAGACFRHLDLTLYLYFKEKLGITIHDTPDLIGRLRMTKEQWEVEHIRTACRFTRSIADALPLHVREGDTERVVEKKIHRVMLEQGCDLAFPSIVAFGDHGAYPHHIPSDRQKTPYDSMLADFGCKYDSYCADLTRVWFLDTIPPSSRRLKEMYDVVSDTCQELVSWLQPGMRAADVDAKARELLSQHGLEEYFIHNTGHGIGLEVHEMPHISKHSTDVLAEGMVITIEPGVYVPQLGGVRYEETVLMTGNGAEVLT